MTARGVLAVAATVYLFTGCSARAPTGSPLEGAWRIADQTVTGADSVTNHSPQPSLVLFSGSFYSFGAVLGTSPRALFRTEVPTDSERIVAFNSFVANSGRFEIADSSLTLHPIVARMPNYMAGGSQVYRYHRSGDTLWLSNRPSDFHIRLGDQIVTPSAPPSEERLVLLRMP